MRTRQLFSHDNRSGHAWQPRRGRWRAAGAGIIGAGIIAVLAAGCSILGFGNAVVETCPRMVGLDDGVRQVIFQRGGGRDLTDIVHMIGIEKLSGDCEADLNTRQLDAELVVTLTAESGPADVRREGLIRYFVALVGPDRQILHREPRSLVFSFPEGANRVIMRETIELAALPLTVGDRIARYRLVAGLILTPEQLDYNRRNRGLLP